MTPSQLISLLLLIVGTGLCHSACQPANPEVGSACDYAEMVVISWSGNVVVNSSNCDLTTDKNEFAVMPEVSFPGADPDMFYALLMMDPDVPSYSEGEYWLHWAVANMPGSYLQTGDIDDSTDLIAYQGPSPPEGSGDHRYQFFLFEQNPVKIELSIPDNRNNFRLDKWLEKRAQKKGLCSVAAGVQFRASF